MIEKKKYIHYCWFGGKPLPKLAKKCIESWKKYLPDYEIIKWSEENTNMEECPFVRGAYDNKKWAFVADYFRTKALKEMGGIYFDTDMEITTNIDDLIKKGNSFLGVEDTGKIACGVWYEKEKGAFLPTQLLEKYKSFKCFDINNMSSFSIPLLITDILEPKGFKYNKKEIQVLENDFYIYPRDYFYPISYNWENNIFTSNTCMVHYYDATWIPIREKIEINLVRKFGRERVIKWLDKYYKVKYNIIEIMKKILFPIVLYRDYKRKKLRITDEYLIRIEETISNISKYHNSEYITIHNKDFSGVTSSTKELFVNTIDCGEIYRKKDIKRIAKVISTSNINQIIFSSLSQGHEKLIKTIYKYNNKKIIKLFWHGSHSQILDKYGWDLLRESIYMMRQGIIKSFATCKKSLYNFYKKEGLNVYFISNTVSDMKNVIKKKKNEIIVGMYAAKCDDWRKNMFSQMSAVALIPNAKLDMVPLNDKAKKFAEIIGLKIIGEEKPLERNQLMERISQNDITLYVTYSECAPMLPLESFNYSTPCITGNNHHYFKNSELEKYVVVNNEDDILDIKEKILSVIENRKKIMKLYKCFYDENIIESKKEVDEFIKEE